jgi:hypothetical protein
MVRLLPNNYNPTSNDIDIYLHSCLSQKQKHNNDDINTMIEATIREIRMKQDILHPSERYFLDTYESIWYCALE